MPELSRATAACAVAAVLALVGCSTGPPSSTPAPASAAASTPAPGAPPAAPGTPGTPGTSAPETPARPDGRLTLAFAGDVHFDEELAPLLEHPDTALTQLRPYLAGADLAMVNLETSITSRGTPAPKTYHFRAPPTALPAVASAGVDVVTMANNHAVDYGEVGLRDTLAALRGSPVPVVGVGEDAAAAYRPAVLEAAGRRVAVLGATQVPEWTRATWPAGPARPGVAVSADPARLAAAVRAARRTADVVVVYLHWGTDYTTCPDAAQRATAAALARAGADVVVGGHAHRVQGSGWLARTYVGYGLGNFVWSGRNGPADARTGVLTLVLDGRRVVERRWTALRVQPDGVPRPPDAAGERVDRRELARADACSGLAARPG